MFMHPPQCLADVLQHPGRFLLGVLREFRTHQGLLPTDAVYGSLTTAIAMLLSLELAATLQPLGAQVISEHELFGNPCSGAALPFATRTI